MQKRNWSEIVSRLEEWLKTPGNTIREFSEKRHVPISALYAAIKQHAPHIMDRKKSGKKKRARSRKSNGYFIDLNGAGIVEIVTTKGLSVKVSSSFDPETLKKVLEVISHV